MEEPFIELKEVVHTVKCATDASECFCIYPLVHLLIITAVKFKH